MSRKKTRIKKKKTQIDLFLTCGECAKTKNDKNKPKKQQNYRTSRAKKPQGEKLSLNKYCKVCQTTQLHQEQIIRKSK